VLFRSGHIGSLARVSGGKESSCEQWRRSCPDRAKGRRRGGRGGDLLMKAVVYKGPREVAVEEVDDPRIVDPTDVIVRITSTAICGSDLHMYEGRRAARTGTPFWRGGIGIGDEVGQGVATVAPGGRVVRPCKVASGFCDNCRAGKSALCLIANEPGAAGGAYGYVGMGPYGGGQ